MSLIIPKGYRSTPLCENERAIKFVKDSFQGNLSAELKLRRVTAPRFVKKGTGINDDLNGIERPVSFAIKNADNCEVEIVQSLAKWKRLALGQLGIKPGYGLYTDMDAIRPDDVLDNVHSVYVDQWDWERVITKGERTIDYLKKMVKKIYEVMKRTEFLVCEEFPHIEPELPEEITFIHTCDLYERWPDLSPTEREDKICKELGALFLIGIGGKLPDGTIHDGRAPDYDDWSTETAPGKFGLNGDILVWNSVLERRYEISSMGIRVDKATMENQLRERDAKERSAFMFHKMILNDELPLSIGGGIGQSRLCMYYLRKAHIGEVQSALWPEEMARECAANNITLL